MTRNLLLGLTVAGVASTLLTTVFRLFHVEVFLKAYELPLSSYSNGNFIFSIINTVNDLIGAWIVDQSSATTTIERSDMVGWAGMVFALCFLTPFFRWKSSFTTQQQQPPPPPAGAGADAIAMPVPVAIPTPRWQDTCHFVMTMSLYDTLYSFTTILIGSIVTDDHTMTYKKRVQFMASGKAVNLFASFAVARIGLSVFDTKNMIHFRLFVVILATLAAALFATGHFLMNGMLVPSNFFNHFGLLTRRKRNRRHNSNRNLEHQTQGSPIVNKPKKYEDRSDNHQQRKLQWKQVALDFWRHRNFRRWVIMEMLLEAQVTFSSFFLKTFVDGLVVVEGGFSRDTCDWFLAMVRPMIQVATIFAYIPIRQFGYPRLYTALFIANIAMAILMLLFSTPQSPLSILLFLTSYSVITGAVHHSGYHLAMADMVLEMKRMHATEGRLVEPSLAGLFMGTNALFCKPAQSALPVIAATVMEHSSSNDRSLFYLLVLPPLFCSIIQIITWRRFSLTPSITASMRSELISLEQKQETDSSI